MSWFAIAYAETATVVDVYERSILTLMAHRADPDGTGCWPSIRSMAEFACCDDKTIERRLAALRRRKVIAYGDQKLVRHVPADKRPKVYDILIPYDWYSAAQMAEVDRERAKYGKPSLAPESRPAAGAGHGQGPQAPIRQRQAAENHPCGKRRSGQVRGPARGLTVPRRGVYKTPRRRARTYRGVFPPRSADWWLLGHLRVPPSRLYRCCIDCRDRPPNASPSCGHVHPRSSAASISRLSSNARSHLRLGNSRSVAAMSSGSTSAARGTPRAAAQLSLPGSTTATIALTSAWGVWDMPSSSPGR